MITSSLIIVALFLGMSSGETSNQWQEGTGENTILGTISPSDIDKDSYENMGDPLDRVLSKYQQGCRIVYASASTITVESGEAVMSNSGGTIRLFQQNTSDTTVSWSDIDTGSEASGTRYYVWLFQETVTTATFDVCVSLSSAAPSGKTYYRLIGNFYNDSSGNITDIQNDGFFSDLGEWVSKSSDVSYQALTDGYIVAYSEGQVGFGIWTDGANPPTTYRVIDEGYIGGHASCTCPVPKGDYYKVSSAASVVFWMPIE